MVGEGRRAYWHIKSNLFLFLRDSFFLLRLGKFFFKKRFEFRHIAAREPFGEAFAPHRRIGCDPYVIAQLLKSVRPFLSPTNLYKPNSVHEAFPF